MMSELKLGMLGKQKVDVGQLKGGLKQADLQKAEHQLIFSKIDKKDNGIIEQDKMKALTESLQKNAGNSKQNNQEALKLLKNMVLNDTGANELFEFLQISAEQSKNIKSAKNVVLGGDKYAINVEYMPDKDGNTKSTMYGANGVKISDTVKDKSFAELTTVYKEDGETVSHYEKTHGAVSELYDTSNRLIKRETLKAEGVRDGEYYEYNGDETQPYKVTASLANGTVIVKEDGYTTTVTPDGKITSDNPLLSGEQEQVLENSNDTVQTYSNGRILTVKQDENGNKISYIQENENSEPVQVKYDENGNILSNAKEGETFAQTAKRLGIEKNSPEYEKFKELNSTAAKKGWFIVGAEVKIPAGMEEKINLEGLNVNAKAENQKFELLYNEDTTTVNTQPQSPESATETPTAPTAPMTQTIPINITIPTNIIIPTTPTVPSADTTQLLPEARDSKDIVKSLIDDIYAKTSLGLPTTGKDIGKHISEINADNVQDIMKLYKSTNKDKESLLEAIIAERGLPSEERVKYLSHIKQVLIDNAKQNGVHIEDISSDFDNEVRIQMRKVGFADAEYLDSFIKKLNARNEAVERRHFTPVLKPNGRIDEPFFQSTTGNCWLLAGIQALAQTPKGLEILNDSIKVDDKGNVEVTLKGAGRSYIISPEELDANIQFSRGDGDVRAIEIAMDRYFREERGVRSRIDLNGNQTHVAFQLLTGDGGRNFLRDRFEGRPKTSFSDSQIDNFNTPNHVASVYAGKKNNLTYSTDKGKKQELVANHAYAVKGSDKENVYIVNPWYTSKVITVPREIFKEFFEYIDEFDL